MQNSELAAIARCQSGDLTAFADLYDIYVKRIYDFIYYRTSHKETAEDLTSVTFTKAFQNINSYRGENGFFSAWLFKIARNTLIDHMRTNKPTVDLEAAANAPSKDNVFAQTLNNDRLEQVKVYLSKLNQDQQEVVMMRLWDQLTYAEIAGLTGKTEGNCKVIFSRVMQKMQKELLPILLYILLVINLFNPHAQ